MIDFETAFVGGLDICFGRWDLKQHPLADVHPESITKEVWPGQDYNNVRITRNPNTAKLISFTEPNVSRLAKGVQHVTNVHQIVWTFKMSLTGKSVIHNFSSILLTK